MHISLAKDRLHAAVDLLILSEKDGTLQLLLSRRTMEPYQNQWALPGCFLGLTESADEAAERLLEEMLPIGQVYKEQLYTFTEAGRDLRGRVISIAYLVIVPWQKLQQTISRTKMHCFTVAANDGELTLTDGHGQALSIDGLAFDHGSILKIGIARIQGKIEYSDIGFHFLNTPQAFALSEMQRIYEAVLGKPQDSSNFRRYISSRYEGTGVIEQTNMEERGRRGRPAVLYRMKTKEEKNDE
ncbi:MAG: NUDIX domain-containing protein [Clostridia bacterium]|nr:NUDIX domain-containing protein [Clostridia bacterium]